MPHCIIEYSSSLEAKVDPQQLISATFDGTEASGLFDAKDIKVRAIPFSHHFSGGAEADFIHVTAKIMLGRSVEQRQQLSSAVLRHLADLGLESISLTVEVIEIETPSYAKQVR